MQLKIIAATNIGMVGPKNFKTFWRSIALLAKIIGSAERSTYGMSLWRRKVHLRALPRIMELDIGRWVNHRRGSVVFHSGQQWIRPRPGRSLSRRLGTSLVWNFLCAFLSLAPVWLIRSTTYNYIDQKTSLTLLLLLNVALETWTWQLLQHHLIPSRYTSSFLMPSQFIFCILEF